MLIIDNLVFIMIFCPKCGIQVEENVSFCPNCGATLTQQSQLIQHTVPPYVSTRNVTSAKNEGLAASLNQSIKVGVYGVLLAVIINLFSPIYLYFIPSFLAAILVVYIFKLGILKDGLVAVFTTYIFSDAILNTIGLASLYLANGTYNWSVDISAVFFPIINAVTALIAAYIGVWLVQKMRFMRSIEV